VYVDLYLEYKFFFVSHSDAGLATIFDADCREAYYAKWCPALFPGCSIQTVPEELDSPMAGSPIAVPHNPCRHLCQEATDTCGNNLAPFFLICDPDLYFAPFYGNPRTEIWPPNSTYTALIPVPSFVSNFTLYYPQQLLCYDDNFTVTIDYSNFRIVCPETDQITTTHNGCSFSCPEPIIKSGAYNDIEIMMSVVGWVSFVVSGFLILSWILDEDKRRVPLVLPLWFFVCTNAIAFVFCYGNMAGQEDFWCEDDYSPNDWGNGSCTFQGIIYVYFTLAGALWWFDICIALFLSIVLGSHDIKVVNKTFSVLGMKLNGFHVISHLVCWSLPWVSVIIALSAHRVGYDGAALWCSVHSDDFAKIVGQDGGIQIVGGGVNWWLIGLVIIPVFVLLVSSLFLVALIAIYTIKQLHQVKLVISVNWRLFVFIFTFFVVYTLTLTYQIYLGQSRDEQYGEYETYLNCERKRSFLVSLEEAGLQNNQTIVDCHLDYVVSEYFLGFVVFFEAAQGIFVFLIFGTAINIYTTWWKILTCKKSVMSSSKTSDTGISKQRSGNNLGIPTVTGKPVHNPEKKLALGMDSMMDSMMDAMSGSVDSDSFSD